MLAFLVGDYYKALKIISSCSNIKTCLTLAQAIGSYTIFESALVVKSVLLDLTNQGNSKSKNYSDASLLTKQ